jgi:hypothetical protein
MALGSVFSAFIAYPSIAYPQDKSGFPDGYDAVQAAPNSHKVIFENAFVRVLEVFVPAPGTTEPMHHHRWPSFFLDWDTGDKTPHVRYLCPVVACGTRPAQISWLIPASGASDG